MDFRIFLLALATFVTGTAENIVIGILPEVASGLDIPIGLAGQLTAVFSITFALIAPMALFVATRLERKAMLCLALLLFIASNLLAAASASYAVLFMARIGMAAASAVACLVATMLAAELAGPAMRGRAIGIIFMGISGSMVLGVPVGMLIGGHFGWRAVFVALALLAAAVLLICLRTLPTVGHGQPAASGYRQHLRSLPLVAAQLVSILMIGGHFMLFAYLAPYLTDVVGVAQGSITLFFLAFGIAGVCGGYCGGWLADVAGPRLAIVATPLAYLVALLAIPLAAKVPGLFIIAMMAWAMISWMISPVVQSFLIATGPQTAEAGVGLNLSAMHVGVGLGTALGGSALAWLPLQSLPWLGGVLAAGAVAAAFVAVHRGAQTTWMTQPDL
ncbi:MFS transporter [Mesorhizobium sp. UC22_110]|jgi:DHA1 family purine base/nucleoside efflux pump-like MFS transporter|uniref:MFS transporter n=1 Tax=unclassified Mesorhizobium TaxID=325217 RepID=UPI00366C221A